LPRLSLGLALRDSVGPLGRKPVPIASLTQKFCMTPQAHSEM
jgi:hypothetical protein